MDSRWQFACFALAILIWVVVPMVTFRGRKLDQLTAIAWGLAVFALPFMWNAAVAGW